MANLIGMNANQVPTNGMLGTLAFRDTLSDLDVLPTQTSNSGKFLTTNGTNASWASPTVPRVEITTDTVLDGTHSGKLIIITSATQRNITLPLSTAVPDGWFCYLQNKSTGSDYHLVGKNAGDTYAECSDGANTWISYAFYPEEVRMVMKATAGFKSIVLRSFNVTITSTVLFSRPPGYSAFAGLLWGGGGSGGRSGTGGYFAGGGGGGACTPFHVSKATFGGSQTITIGAGGTARTGAQAGVAGGDSFLGSMFGAFGGGGGGVGIASNVYACGGGGGGAWSAGTTGVYKSASTEFSINGGRPCIASSGPDGTSTDLTILDNQGFGGARGAISYPGVAAYGGGGGASSGMGGSSVFGGGGGGGSSFGGASPGGGAGGMGSVASSASAGTVPAGGGGGTQTGTSSGAGANGQCIIWGIV